jgi:hypothetical protein
LSYAFLELLFFLLADLGLELFLHIKSKLFSFGFPLDNFAERSFVWGLGLVGNLFIPFAMVDVGQLLLDLLKLLVKLLLLLLQLLF